MEHKSHPAEENFFDLTNEKITDFFVCFVFLFSSEAIRACKPLDSESHGIIAHMALESNLREGTVGKYK